MWLTAVLVVGLVGGGVWAGLLADREQGAPSAGTTPQPASTTAPTPTVTPSPAATAEGWQVLPETPFRVSDLVVWAGRELVVGERANLAPPVRTEYGEITTAFLSPPGLAALNPQTGQWRALPDHPAGCRGMDAALWTGRELLFVGGYTTADCMPYPLGPGLPDQGDPVEWLDSYALDVAAGTWRTLSAPPQPLFSGTQCFAAWWDFGPPVWTGQLVLALDTPDPADLGQPVHVMLFDPDTDTWRVGDPVPGPPRREFVSVWTGRHLLAWGGIHASATYYDEQSLPAEAAPEAYWDADQQRWVISHTEWLADGWAYDPVADTWAPISPAPIPGASQSSAAWTGTEMIVWGGPTGADVWPYQPNPVGAAYNPTTDTWRTIADPPGDAVGEIAGQSVWTGTEFIVWSGRSFTDYVGAAYNPATDTWRALPGSPLYSGTVGHAVWTGDSVLGIGYLREDAQMMDAGEQPTFSRVVEYRPGPYR
jgi:hypothetical protein